MNSPLLVSDWMLEDPAWLGGGMYGAWRPGGGARLALTIGAGSSDGRLYGRGELLAQFPLVESAMEMAGFTVWPQVVFEADDGMAAAAVMAAA